jgi:hypothetical protein
VPARPQESKATSPKNDWRQQVEAMMWQQSVNQKPTEKLFEFDSTKPLTLVKEHEKN